MATLFAQGLEFVRLFNLVAVKAGLSDHLLGIAVGTFEPQCCLAEATKSFFQAKSNRLEIDGPAPIRSPRGNGTRGHKRAGGVINLANEFRLSRP